MTGTGAWGTPWFGLWRDESIDRILKSDEQDYQLVPVNRSDRIGNPCETRLIKTSALTPNRILVGNKKAVNSCL